MREELPKGQVTLLLVDFAEECPQFGGTGCIERNCTGASGITQTGFPYSLKRVSNGVTIQVAELIELPLVDIRREPPECGVMFVDSIQPGVVELDEEGVRGFLN